MSVRLSKRVTYVGALLVAFILCQGQSCGPVATNNVFQVVGSPDASLDGTWLLAMTRNGQIGTTEVKLQGGVPVSLGAGEKIFLFDGQSHANPSDAATTYVGTGEAGRQGSAFTMKILFTMPEGVTETMAFTGTIASDGTISGTCADTLAAPGAEDNVTNFTFTMIKQ